MQTRTQANLRVLSIGSLPPAWGGRDYGGVATLHATLLHGLLDPDCPVDPVAVISPKPLDHVDREPPVPVLVRPSEGSTAEFYERVLAELRPDVVVMHHFAHTIGLTHARMSDPPPAIGIAHSWHNITFGAGEERERARATTAEALGGLRAIVGMSRHLLREGEELGLPYPAIVETIYHPLPPLYAGGGIDPGARERRGVACLGSLIPRKAPETLVEAAARLPGLDVVFAGHGQLEASLRSSIAARGLADRVGIRHLDDRQVRELLLGCEAMCLPSRSETFGIAYIEALACGTPVVGFGPTLREIRDEIGIEIGVPLERGAGPGEIAAGIERVRQGSWDRGELRRRTVAAFDLPAATARYAALIERVATAGPDGGGARPAARPSHDPICVLGMSRSGTSLTARVLSLAGVYLGPDEELLGGELRHLAAEGDEVVARARKANPGGFWEHYRIMRLNERILKTLGGSWREPPPMPPGWESSEEIVALRDEARAILAESFGGHQLWGWKDPRNSLTLPFWQALLPEMRYVICLRNPADVAASLQRRDAIAPAEGVEQWMRYLAAALVNTSGRPRLLVPYEAYFSSPLELASRLAGFAGREGALDGAEGERLLAEAIDERLWRNRAAAGGGAEAAQVAGEAAALFRVAELLAILPEADGDGAGRTARSSSAADVYAQGVLDRLAKASPAPAP